MILRLELWVVIVAAVEICKIMSGTGTCGCGDTRILDVRGRNKCAELEMEIEVEGKRRERTVGKQKMIHIDSHHLQKTFMDNVGVD